MESAGVVAAHAGRGLWGIGRIAMNNDHRHLLRLSRIYLDNPLYFITTCTYERRRVLACAEVAAILQDEFALAKNRHGWHIGRYTIMPDHVHFFCRAGRGHNKTLPRFMNLWKEWTSKRIAMRLECNAPIWQKGFFDHLLRSDESYAEKWSYVSNNPVRAGMVARVEDWPYQGCVDFDI